MYYISSNEEDAAIIFFGSSPTPNFWSTNSSSFPSNFLTPHLPITTMKKLFQRMDQGSREPSSGHTSYIGKVFVVGRYSVTVEDTIAEGEFWQLCCIDNYSPQKLLIWLIQFAVPITIALLVSWIVLSVPLSCGAMFHEDFFIAASLGLYILLCCRYLT